MPALGLRGEGDRGTDVPSYAISFPDTRDPRQVPAFLIRELRDGSAVTRAYLERLIHTSISAPPVRCCRVTGPGRLASLLH